MGEKSVAKNAAFNVLYKIMNMLFPLVTTVYISHILTASGVGKVSVGQNASQYFVLLAPLGIINYGTREIARIRNNKEESDKLFSELFLLNACSTVICTLAYYSLIAFGDYFSKERLLFAVTGLAIVFNIVNVEWYYQGQEEYVYISLRSIAIKVLSLIAMVLFVKKPGDYVIYAFIYIIGIAGNHVLNVINLIKRKVKPHFHGLEIKRHIHPVFILLASSIAIELYTLVDTTMLGYICPDEIVGYYNNAVKLDRIVVGLISAIGAVLLPRISFYLKNGRIDESNGLLSKVVRVMAFLAIPCGIGVWVLSDKIVLVLFGPTFEPAITTVRIGTLLIYILAFSNLFGTQVLLSFNQERKLLMCTLMGAISNIAMNIFLIPTFMHNGAIVASVISEALVAFLSIKMGMKYVKISIVPGFWIKSVLSGMIMGVIVYVCSSNISNQIISMTVGTMVGAATYLIANIILKNPIILEYKRFFERG